MRDQGSTAVPTPPVLSRSQAASVPLRLLHRWEAATALMLAANPTPESPHRLARMLQAWLPWRAHPVGGFIASAARHPERFALVDEDGPLSFADLDADTNALARAWQARGIGQGTTIGILSHNGRLFVQASLAAQKLGADVVYLNTEHSGPQVAGVVEDEGVEALVVDAGLVRAASAAKPRLTLDAGSVREALGGSDRQPLRPPSAPGRTVVLTSGTTGRPKGAVRRPSGGALDAAGLLASVPVVAGDTMVVAAPLFHGLGLTMSTLALSLSSTVVVRSHFDPEATLHDIATNRATVLVGVPVLLRRVLELPPRVLESHDVSSLRVVLCGGSALSAELGSAFMDRFGDIVYNFYGSTEASFATVAGPRDLRAVPGTAGRVTPGVTLRIADEWGHPVPTGERGRILVGSPLRMDGYTGGLNKDVVDGLVVTGDVGRLDRCGRLFVEGRDDEMIVSGGENVFPAEVEDCLTLHPAVVEVAVIGVADDEFGERLRAYVVCEQGSAVSADELKAWVHDRLARFKTPRDVVFRDALSRNAAGKVLKRELREE